MEKHKRVENGFKALGLSDTVYKGTVRLGFRMPTPVQRKSLPVALSGVDTIVQARTGSGKTCAFLIPLLEKLLSTPKGEYGGHVRGLVLSPTRELSIQTLRVFTKLTVDAPGIRAVGIHGGEGIEKQFHLLSTKPDVVIATPGRLAHHLEEIPDFKLSGCLMCVLDEADRLFEMGFGSQIRQIASSLPDSCQKLLFSATMPRIVVDFTKTGFTTNPAIVRLDDEVTVSDELRIAFVTCRSTDKDAALLHVMEKIRLDTESHANSRTGLTLVFAATRYHVEYITTLLHSSGIEAVMIYGTLDQEAREANLSAFRRKERKVLVVTDVAARGIDVPLIDHVIHYHFPASPTLFIHRSGRCARAGRIGFCWGLVEPDEMPYMIDLHVFLGRPLRTGTRSSPSEKCDTPCSYSLSQMTPDMVHVGSVPESDLAVKIEWVQRIINSELSGSCEAETLRSLTKACLNAMKQYRRTRVGASSEAVRRAKALLDGDAVNRDERIYNGAIPSHPLFNLEHSEGRGADINACDEGIRSRGEFLRAMSKYRPKETVFEAFTTHGNRDAGCHSSFGQSSAKFSKPDSGSALEAVKGMRRQMKIVRDRGASLVVAGRGQSVSTKVIDAGNDANSSDRSSEDVLTHGEACTSAVARGAGITRRNVSRAERRRLKKPKPEHAYHDPPLHSVSSGMPTKRKRGEDFRDSTCFAAHETSSGHQIDLSRQSGSLTHRGGLVGGVRFSEALLDVVDDESDALVRQQRLLRWDKSKRKYVHTTIGSELNGESKTMKRRIESGSLKRDHKLGDLYEKWQKKTNRSIGRSGVFDDGSEPSSADQGRVRQSSTTTSGRISELKSVASIKKDRAKKQNMRIKNMKRVDRKAYDGGEKYTRR